MDKEGFKIVDHNYQQELSGHKQRITEKYNGKYANKVYQGSREEQAKARAVDDNHKKQQINAGISGVEKQLGANVFEGKQRSEVLKELEHKEEVKKRTEEIKKEFQRKAKEQNRGRQ